MQKLLLIATHEFVKHIKRVSFLIGTLLVPFVGVSFVLIMGFIEGSNALPMNTSMSNGKANRPSLPIPNPLTGERMDETATIPTKIGYVDHAGVIMPATEQLTTSFGVEDTLSRTLFFAFPDETTAKQAMQHNDITVYYILDKDYLDTGHVTRYAPKVQFAAQDREHFSDFLRINLLQGTDERIALRLGNVANFELVRLQANGDPMDGRFASIDLDSGNSALLFLPLAFALLLYIAIFSSAGLLQNSVIEEKENRVLEILLTSIQPWQLLGGKILGLGILGLGQLLIWISSYGLLIYYDMVKEALLVHVALPLYVWILIIPYYLLGYLLYGGLMAGIGATMTSTREGSFLTTLLSIPVMLPFMVIFIIVDQPDGWLAVLLSLFPYTASITMITRLTLVDVVWWQIILSMVLLVGAVLLSVKVSAKLFHTTMLLKGKKLSVREVWHALRVSTG